MNIIEYVEKFGAERLGERPFNEVDSLILSELSYLNFTPLLRGGREMRLGELAKECETLVKDTLLPKGNTRLIGAIADSPRFQDMTVCRFREKNDSRREIRFAAVCFRCETGTYVALRGTDITLLGWKEDFNMVFRRSIPSQELALGYLSEVARAEKGALIVGGHSKGGNLALFAALHATPAVRERITAVYNHDGPGFREQVFERPEYLDIRGRVHNTVPHDSLIGILLNHPTEYRVVISRSVLIGQHNPFAWAVKDGGSFVLTAETTKLSKRFDRTLKAWIDGMNDATRRKFVNGLFAVIAGSGAKTVPEFKKGVLKKIRGMKRAYRALPDEERALIGTGGKTLLKLWLRAARGKTE